MPAVKAAGIPKQTENLPPELITYIDAFEANLTPVQLGFFDRIATWIVGQFGLVKEQAVDKEQYAKSLKEKIQLLEKALASDQLDFAIESLVELGQLYEKFGQCQKGIETQTQALVLAMTTDEQSWPQMARISCRIGKKCQGEINENILQVIALHREIALKVYAEKGDITSPEALDCGLDLANNYVRQNEIEKAVNLYQSLLPFYADTDIEIAANIKLIIHQLKNLL